MNAVLLVVVALVYLHRRRKSEAINSAADYAPEAYKREPGTAIPVEMGARDYTKQACGDECGSFRGFMRE